MGSVLTSAAPAALDSAIAAAAAAAAAPGEPVFRRPEHDARLQELTRRDDARERIPIAAVKGLVGAALRHYNANNKSGAGFVPLEPSMAACRACCCGPKGFTRLVGFWARRRRGDAPPPETTPDCFCFYAELHFDRVGSLVIDTCIIIGKPPSRQEQLTDKQPRPNKKKKQLREMEEIREFCPSYEEALQLNPTDEAVSEEELRHLHCC